MFSSFLRATILFLLLLAVGVETRASVISHTRTVTARNSSYVLVGDTLVETILAEEVTTFDGINQATVQVEADRAAFMNVHYSGPARALATIKALDVGTATYVNSHAFVTGQTIATPLDDGSYDLLSEVEEVAIGVAPVGDGVRVLYSFDLKDMWFEMWDHRPSGEGSGIVGAEISYSVELNGRRKFGARATLGGFGRFDAVIIAQSGTDGVDFMGRPVAGLLDPRPESTGPGDVPRRIEFDNKSVHFLDLGIAPGGESYEVRTTMVARLGLPEVAFDAFDFGGQVNIGDPNDLSGIGFGQITEITVPEPTAAWLLLAGLGALAAFHRRAP